MTIDIYSVISLLHIAFVGTDPIASATGFLWRDVRDSQYYLVTNYHVLSGRHPETGKIEDLAGRTPTRIRVYQNRTTLGEWVAVDYPLLDKAGKPRWREHPRFGRKVDVVLLPVDLPAGTTGYAINDQRWTELQLRPAETVSIVGFPRGETARGLLAIWQTGYVASEPEFNFRGVPALLVDSRAWPGNSGSPVIARRYGSWSNRDGSQSFGSGTGFATDFVGVYPGRIGEAEMKFVWKRSVIDDILR